jgi:two-component system phosphate regulon response regulator PhoB
MTIAPLLLVIGASAAEADRVAAFECGADDYVVRPFSPRELVLRIRALCRRTQGRGVCAPDSVTIGSVFVDRGARRVMVDGVRVALTRREFDLLMRFIDSRGRLLTRSAIVRQTWPDGDRSERVVDTALKRLRRKLPAFSTRLRTVRGVGYQFVDDESELEN